jgi:hypothetical protein
MIPIPPAATTTPPLRKRLRVSMHISQGIVNLRIVATERSPCETISPATSNSDRNGVMGSLCLRHIWCIGISKSS